MIPDIGHRRQVHVMNKTYESYADLISTRPNLPQHTTYMAGDHYSLNRSANEDFQHLRIHMEDDNFQKHFDPRDPDAYIPINSRNDLFEYEDIPRFLQGNPFIKKGYRVYLSQEACYRSLFAWSNETMNMWTHLVGFLLFFGLMFYDNLVLIPQVQGSFADHSVITIGLLCFQICMLCSTGYHMFRCQSENADKKWLAYDLTGISLGLLGCYLPGVHYAFYCLSVWRDIYLIFISILFASVLACQTQTRYYTEAWFQRRIILYCGLALYGVLPTIHWIYLNGGMHTDIVQRFGPKVFVVYMFGMLAFLFYITKAPEKCCPGHVDYIGSSHQLWHVVIVLAFLWWHQSGLELLQYRTENSCLPTE